MSRHLINRSAALAMAAALLMASVGVVSADALQNELDTGSPDLILDTINVALTGGPVTVDVWLDAQNDSDPNCNLDSGDSAVFTALSSNSGIMTVSPASFTVTACGSSNAQQITVTPVAQGSANALFGFDAGSSSVDAGETFTANTGDFTVVVDDPPSVTSTVPANGAIGVAANTNIAVNFSESVNITNVNGWYDIDCTVSGNNLPAGTSGSGTSTVTLDPTSDFALGETCTVTIVKNHVEDTDTVDGFNNMEDSYQFDFTVAESGEAVTPTLTTEVRNADGDAPATSFPLGTAVYDHLSIDPSDAEGTIDFALYKGSDCTDQLGVLLDSWSAISLSAGEADSGDSDPLHADSYYFLVGYNSSDTDQWNDTSTCEDFTIETATTTTETEVHDSSHNEVTTPQPHGTEVHDSAMVSSLNTSFTIGGTVTYSFWSNGACADVADSAETVAVGTESTPQTPAPGSYSYQAHYDGGDDYDGSTSACEPFSIEVPPNTLSALSDVHAWIGLKNSDDQGTQFDLYVELLQNGSPVASGLKRCITGVTRNPSLAKEAIVSWDAFSPATLASGDVLALRFSTRIGTNANGTKCSGPGGSHNNAVGLRLYYDSTSRQSRFDATIGGSNDDWYLRSDGNACVNAESTGVTSRYLSMTAPTATSAKCKDSASINFAGGNLFKVIGTWYMAALP